jgi:hypothetical protein
MTFLAVPLLLSVPPQFSLIAVSRALLLSLPVVNLRNIQTSTVHLIVCDAAACL